MVSCRLKYRNIDFNISCQVLEDFLINTTPGIVSNGKKADVVIEQKEVRTSPKSKRVRLRSQLDEVPSGAQKATSSAFVDSEEGFELSRDVAQTSKTNTQCDEKQGESDDDTVPIRRRGKETDFAFDMTDINGLHREYSCKEMLDLSKLNHFPKKDFLIGNLK